VGRREAVDERQDLAAARVHSQKPRHAVEAAVLEMGKQPVNPATVRIQWPTDRVAGAYYPRCVAAGERHLRLGAIHSRIIADPDTGAPQPGLWPD